MVQQAVIWIPIVAGSAGQPGGGGFGGSVQLPATDTPHADVKWSLQQAGEVLPSGGVQFFSPHGTLPAGGGGVVGPASGALLFVGFFVVSVPPESLPHAIGESPANNTATASPRLTIAMFIASNPSL